MLESVRGCIFLRFKEGDLEKDEIAVEEPSSLHVAYLLLTVMQLERKLRR